MFWCLDAVKEKHMMNVYMNVIWVLQIATGEYKNID